MAACSARWAEELALLAGGDQPTASAEAAARQHAADCAACGRLLTALSADQAGLTELRSETPAREGESLVASVAAALPRQAVGPSVRPALRRGGWLRAAAGFVVVATAAIALVQGPGGARTKSERGVQDDPVTVKASLGAADSHQETVRAPDALPLQVRRTAGSQVELTWDGDGREERTAQEPYRVLASASPRDFGAAQTIEVAGRRLVATAPLPSAPVGGRHVTYFVVQ